MTLSDIKMKLQHSAGSQYGAHVLPEECAVLLLELNELESMKKLFDALRMLNGEAKASE